ncbi:MAG: DNA primase [bacterium]|nr:DNA primase [bacterium]
MEPKEEIRNRLDVSEVISEYLPLKPAGSGSFKALCPFHGEKTPSFHISTEKQIWRCFGCNKGGDIFSFVMEMEGIGFREALEELAKKAGVELPKYEKQQTTDSSQFLYDMMALSGKVYHAVLMDHETGEVARAYMHRRGITPELAKKFQIGYAPESWTFMHDFLKKKGYGEARIEKAGLIKKKQNGTGYLDRFRHRLLIPLHDARGNIVGFTGRTMYADEEAKGPKYLNSPETPIYNKRDVLYGLSFAKSAIRAEDAVIIVEGNLDIIASHKAGVEHIVASSGTALTESQLSLLKRFTNNLVFCFDGDSAGFKAAKRGIHLAQQEGFNVKVITIPERLGKDPDDIVQKSEEAWRELVKHPVPIMRYFIAKHIGSANMSDVEVRREAVHAVLDELSRIHDSIERDFWLDDIATKTGIKRQALESALRAKAGNSAHVSRAPTQKPAAEALPTYSKLQEAGLLIIGMMLADRALFEHGMNRLKADLLPEQFIPLYTNIILRYNHANLPQDAQWKSFFSSMREDASEIDRGFIDYAALLAESFSVDMDRTRLRSELDRHIDLLLKKRLNAKKADLEMKIREAEQLGKKDEMHALLDSYKELI